MQILHPDEAVPLLLDPARSPAVALDTEFDTSAKPTCQAPLTGLSLAGGTPDAGIFCTFWPFFNGQEIHPWGYLRDEILLPLLRDPARHMVMHPPKVDAQILRARGITHEDFRCRMWCTFSMAHIYDENLPKSLKDLGKCLLGMHGQASYAQTQAEIKRIRKKGPREVKRLIKECWEVYRDHRKKSKDIEADIDPTWPPLTQAAMRLPPKMLKRDVEAAMLPIIEPAVLGRYEHLALERFSTYGAEDAGITLSVFYWLLPRLRAESEKHGVDMFSLVDLETQVCHPCVTEMEEHGLKIDCEELAAIYHTMETVLHELRHDVIERWGGETIDDGEEKGDLFNPASTPQVCRKIWDEWQLRPPPWALRDGELIEKWKRKSDGYCKVDKDVLGHLAENAREPYKTHIQKLLTLRAYEKIQGTYVRPMLEKAAIDPNRRIHASFWPVGARTGRFSSDEPNVENIPRPHTMPEVPIAGADWNNPPRGVVKDEVQAGRLKRKVWRVQSLRKVFIPEEGWSLCSADLAQIENRLIAHESQDPTLLALFRGWDCAECGQSGETDQPLHACPNCGAPDGKRDKTQADQPAKVGFCLGRDIHSKSSVAIGLFERLGPVEGRQNAKAVNHAFNYGMGYRTLARREKMKLRAAQKALKALDAEYPYVRSRLHARVRRDVEERGYVQMFDGHVRRFYVQRLLMKSDTFRKWEWEGVIREAVNVLAQGGTGVIMKIAMIRIRERLRTHENPLVRKAKCINQVHDELLYEAPDEVAHEVLAIMCWELEHAVQLLVPVIADGNVAKNWGDAH